MKDWHFVQEVPEYCAYLVPRVFSDDWLNAYWDVRNQRCDHEGEKSDYRFVYVGGGQTWTPLHHDVYLSNSWSANLSGVKLWILFPPQELHNLKDKWNTSFFPDVRLLTVVQEALRSHLQKALLETTLESILRDFIFDEMPPVDKVTFPLVDKIKSVKIAVQLRG
jgi:hypothetical protein